MVKLAINDLRVLPPSARGRYPSVKFKLSKHSLHISYTSDFDSEIRRNNHEKGSLPPGAGENRLLAVRRPGEVQTGDTAAGCAHREHHQAGETAKVTG